MKKQSGDDKSRLFRKGEVGDWKEHFSPALAAEFDAQLAKQMRGVNDPYAERHLGDSYVPVGL
jgi:hypothetical protein